MHTCCVICLIIMYSDIPLSQEFLAWCLRQTRARVRTKRLRQNLFGSDATMLGELIEKCGEDDDSPCNFRYLLVLRNSHLASFFAHRWLLDKHTKLCPWTLFVMCVQQRSNSSVFWMQPLQLWSFPVSNWGFVIRARCYRSYISNLSVILNGSQRKGNFQLINQMCVTVSFSVLGGCIHFFHAVTEKYFGMW